jgi:hypothetical protein
MPTRSIQATLEDLSTAFLWAKRQQLHGAKTDFPDMLNRHSYSADAP